MNMGLFPKAALMRLRYPQKFVLISLLFALPLAVVLFLLVSETSARLNNYGYQEKYGVEYLRVTRRLMQDIQEHQQLTDSDLRTGASGLATQISQQRTTITQDFAALEQVNNQYGPTFKSNEAVRALQQDWQALIGNAQPLSLTASDEQHAGVLADLRSLISLVGNTSYLILDPDLDTYYMMDTVLLKLPETQDLLAQTLVIGQNAAEQQTWTSDERTQVLLHIGLLRSNLDAMKTNVQVALDNNPAQTLRPLVAEPLRAHIDALEQFLTVAVQSTTVAPGQVIDLSEFVAAGQRALTQSYQFYDAASPALEITIQTRIDRLLNRQIVTVLISLIGVLLGFGIGVSVMRNISRPLGQLTAATQRLASGDLSARVSEAGGVEIAAVGAAFNEMAQRLHVTLNSLEDRTAQLRTSSDVGRAAASILDTNHLLREIVNLITDRFGFYYAAVFLADNTNKWAVLHEATGNAGRALKERKHQLEIGGQSLVGSVMKTRKARIALAERVGDEAVRFANPLLPDTRSEIALPLMVGSRAIGALDVQSTEMAAFDEASAAVLQSMADQIAIALSNARLFQQTQAGLQRTRQLYEASTAISNAEDASSILRELMTKGVPDAAAAQILTYGPQDETGHYAYFEVAASWAHPGSELLLPAGTRVGPDQVPPIPALASEPYLIPDAADPATSPEQQQIMQAMHMRALLGYALVAGAQPVGLLLIGYREPRLFMAAETQPLQALTGQVAVTLRNQQLVRDEAATVQQLDEINRRLTGQAWDEYARTIGAVTYKEDVGPATNAMSETAPTVFAAPITIHGEEVGVLRLEDTAPDRKWTPNELALAHAVAGEVAIALENARLLEETERRAQHERLVADISSRMFASNDMETIIQIAGQELGRVLRVDRTEVRLSSTFSEPAADAITSPQPN